MGFIPLTRGFHTLSDYIGVYPWVFMPLFKLTRLLGVNTRSTVQDFAQAQVEMQRENPKLEETDSFLSRMLAMHKTAKLSMDEVCSIAAVNIAAGSDTTSITLCAIFWHLMKNPSAMRKVCHKAFDH
jgi:cytochrome P450